MVQHDRDVCSVPKADIAGMVKMAEEELGPLATCFAAPALIQSADRSKKCSDARAGVAPGNRLNDQNRQGRDTDEY
jgi:hypothetical protein